MTNSVLNELSVGTSDFHALRERDEIYIDKTSMIYDLARVRGKYFLARPRRFGKSLLVSTFASLFAHGLRDFHGLAIEGLWADKTYQVVRLDFSSLKVYTSRVDFERAFRSMVTTVFGQCGFQYDVEDPNRLWLDQLKLWLKSLPASSLVLLIDEYDTPLTHNLSNAEAFCAIRDTLEAFYSAIKEYDGCLRFFFMTGITRFGHTSIFSAFNHLRDISLDPLYGTLLGLTQEEISHCYDGYLKRAQDVLRMDRETLLETLRSYYDGFSFDEQVSTHVFCPWSVLNFLSSPHLGFKDYWYRSGGKPGVLTQYLKEHSLNDPRTYGTVSEIALDDLSDTYDYDSMPLEVLLIQTGYFTLRSVSSDGLAVIGYPNREVAVSMGKLYSERLLEGKNYRQPGKPALRDVMVSGTVNEVVAYFNDVFDAIDYHRYPATDEASCRALLQVLMIGARLEPKVEMHTALGRSDLELDIGARHWVFEIKFARKEDDEERLLAEAVRQIENQRYGLLGHGNELVRVALVFSQERRCFVRWQTLQA